MDSRRITAVVAALILGAGTAVSCSGADTGDREDVNQGNEGVKTSEGGRIQTERGPTTLQSTGPDQPEVTQPETGP